jgi:type II secretory pathway component PulM
MSSLLQKMRDRVDALPSRDRYMLNVGSVIAALIVVGGSLLLLEQRTSATRERLDRKQHDLAYVQAAVAEIMAAGPLRPAGASNEPLVVLMDRLARQAGLRDALSGSESGADGSLRANFAAAPFDALAGMLAQLQQQGGATVQSASISALPDAGHVNASIVLHAAAAH